MAKRKKSFKKRRPVPVWIIAIATVALFLLRLYQAYDPVVRRHILQIGITGPLFTGWRFTAEGFTFISSIIYLVLAVSGLIVLAGFLRLRRWSWVMLMAWTGASLTISLVDYFTSNPNYAVMTSNVIIAFALNIPDVQRIYKIRKDDEPGQ
jgi:hypothetical protein